MLSEDGGVSWESMQLNASGITRGDDVKGAFFLNENKGWLVGRESQGYAFVLRTNDGGLTWEKSVVEDAYNFGSIWFLDNDEGYATVNAIDVGDDLTQRVESGKRENPEQDKRAEENVERFVGVIAERLPLVRRSHERGRHLARA